MRRVLVSGLLSVLGLILWAQPSEAANPAVGRWKMTAPDGESDLVITENDGKLAVQQIGLGNVTSKVATCQDGLLVFHWQHPTTGYSGYCEFNLNKKHTTGKGKVVYTRYPKDYKVGVEQNIEGRKVRVAEGVTIERIGQ